MHNVHAVILGPRIASIVFVILMTKMTTNLSAMTTKPITKLALTLVTVATVLSASIAQAIPSLDTGSAEYVGSVTRSAPSNPANEVVYINEMIKLGLNGSLVYDANNTIERSGKSLTLPEAKLADSVKDDTDPSNQVDITGWTYLYAKYGSGNNSIGAYVWLVSGLSGTYEIPSAKLSHWSLYKSTTPPGGNLPDGGSTLALIGVALTGIGFLRRKLS